MDHFCGLHVFLTNIRWLESSAMPATRVSELVRQVEVERDDLLRSRTTLLKENDELKASKEEMIAAHSREVESLAARHQRELASREEVIDDLRRQLRGTCSFLDYLYLDFKSF